MRAPKLPAFGRLPHGPVPPPRSGNSPPLEPDPPRCARLRRRTRKTPRPEGRIFPHRRVRSVPTWKHTSFGETTMTFKYDKRLIGHAAVDSGQILICDPCYIDGTWKSGKSVYDGEEGEFSYAGCCRASLSPRGGGQLFFPNGGEGAGVVFRTRDGDGFFPVYATYGPDGLLESLEIVFWSAAPEDDREDEDVCDPDSPAFWEESCEEED